MKKERKLKDYTHKDCYNCGAGCALLCISFHIPNHCSHISFVLLC